MNGPLAPTAAVLSRRPAVRLLGSSLLGRLPTGMAALAVLLLVRGRGGDYALAGLLSGLYAAGSALGGPLLGRVIDRSRQPPVLLGASLAAAVGFAALAVVPVGGALAVAAIVLAGAATPPLESCLRVLWPRVVPADRLHAAYSLDAAAQEILFVLGPLLVLGAVRLAGPAGGVLVAAGLGVLGVAAFVSTPQSRSWRGVRTESRHPAGPLRSRRLVRLLVSLLLTGFTIGTFSVGATAYAEHVGGRSLAGWFIAANGLGALLGGIGYTLVPAGRDLSGRLRVVAALLAIGYLPLALQPGLAGMIGLSVLSGLSLPAVLTCGFALVERLAPAGTVTEAFTWLVTAFGIGNAVGAALSGTLVDRYGPVAAFLAGAATALLAALTVLRRLTPAADRQR
ncbi:MFS transporter [Actinocatenispora thailandica]|uniref:MFS transporter n=1 Tax=Actinocatenispora thailandica TaxID=227318 RepID=A0A7R7DRX4_9ACTN|nr:MFS transporter [Actinocatenispora thailandica]BCJ36669.1 MFS transporter [Actinocatenispora thailandica]